MNRFILLSTTILTLILSSCGYERTFVVNGEIEKIEKENNLIFIRDKGPIQINHIPKYKVGQTLEVTIVDTSGEDCWCPSKWKVKNVKVLEN